MLALDASGSAEITDDAGEVAREEVALSDVGPGGSSDAN